VFFSKTKHNKEPEAMKVADRQQLECTQYTPYIYVDIDELITSCCCFINGIPPPAILQITAKIRCLDPGFEGQSSI